MPLVLVAFFLCFLQGTFVIIKNIRKNRSNTNQFTTVKMHAIFKVFASYNLYNAVKGSILITKINCGIKVVVKRQYAFCDKTNTTL